ncbi:MAG: hypothetical protein K6F46_08815 [Desulfovibrio sp.]|nr:hypothetical protein [Desulfovibrio sp.]
MSQAMIEGGTAGGSTEVFVAGSESGSASPAAQTSSANAGAQNSESSPSVSGGGSSNYGETLLGTGMNAHPASDRTGPAPMGAGTGQNASVGGGNVAKDVKVSQNVLPKGNEGLFPPYGDKLLPEGASDDQRAEFDRKLRALNGVPQNAADYGDFGLGDSVKIDPNAEDYKYYTELFKDVGLSKAQAGKLLQKHLEYMQGQAEHYKKTNDAQIQEYRTKVKNDFVRQCGGEQGFIEFSQAASRGFQAAAQGAGLSEKDVRGILNVMGDDPRFLRIFNSIGKLYREDVLVTGTAPSAQEKSFEQMFRGMFAHS